MLGVSKEPNHPDFGSSLHAGTRGFSHQNRCGMDSGDLASTARHRHNYHRHHNRFPYLEAQA